MKFSTFLFFLWMAFLFCVIFPLKTYSQTITTPNILPPISSFTQSGITDGAGGTGQHGGGTYSYTTALSGYLTQAQINAGFTLNYSVTVLSHASNTVVPHCGAGVYGDCKDTVMITLSIFDNGALVRKFENSYVLDYSGYRTYSITNVIDANNYVNPHAMFELYGNDAGYYGGMFGPRFLDPILSLTYQIIEQAIAASAPPTVAQNASNPGNPESPVSPANPANTINQPPPQPGPQSSTLSPIAPQSPMAQQQQHQQSGGQQVDVQVDRRDGGGDTATVTVSGPERPAETFTIQLPSAPSGQQSPQSTQSVKSDIQTSKTKEGATSIANSILGAIKDAFDPANQSTKVALMAMLATEYKDRDLQDAAKWYEERDIYLNREVADPYNRLFSIAQDKKMDSLIQLQYNNGASK